MQTATYESMFADVLLADRPAHPDVFAMPSVEQPVMVLNEFDLLIQRHRARLALQSFADFLITALILSTIAEARTDKSETKTQTAPATETESDPWDRMVAERLRRFGC